MSPTALIAEDEPLLARALQAELARAWPELKIVGTVGDGNSAVAEALRLLPDVLFFDIRMPGQGGLEAAAELADAWPDGGPEARPFPVLVFVTAYDQYAVQAFEAQAMDYMLKPVLPERLARTVARVQQALTANTRPAQGSTLEPALEQLRRLLASPPAATTSGAPAASAPLRVIQASVGTTIHMVPVEEVLYFDAADKYVRVLTAGKEYLIRTALKELMPQLDPAVFWQIHRGTVVRAKSIESVSRDDAGKLHLSLHGIPDKLPVSRLYAHLFKAM